MALVSFIYNVYLSNLAKEHELSVEEYLSVAVDLVLADLSYNV